MNAPTQAVILCGGLGTRLRPLTDTLPKPLAPIHGRPFLAFLIEQLREQGIARVLLLTGYRGEMIRECFGDGSRFDVQISYSWGPVEWETGKRVFEARAHLDSQFLLLYSDNFVPLRVNRLAAFHASRPADITLVLQSKDRGNIRLASDGRIDLYDPSRRADGLAYVEVGYMLVERYAALAALNGPNESWSRVIERRVAEGRVSGFVSQDRYHSIADYDRWHLAEQYLAVKRIVLVDRDGTINRRPPRAEYVRTWADFHFIDESVDALRQLADHGFRFIVLSNQAGIARGMQDAADVKAVNDRMVAELRTMGIEVDAVYVCPHHWDEGCECRKPAPGMFFRAAREHLLRMDRTVYLGDDPRDCQAAFNAGCLSVLVGPERSHVSPESAQPSFASDTLVDSVPWILSQFHRWESMSRGAAVC